MRLENTDLEYIRPTDWAPLEQSREALQASADRAEPELRQAQQALKDDEAAIDAQITQLYARRDTVRELHRAAYAPLYRSVQALKEYDALKNRRERFEQTRADVAQKYGVTIERIERKENPENYADVYREGDVVVRFDRYCKDPDVYLPHKGRYINVGRFAYDAQSLRWQLDTIQNPPAEVLHRAVVENWKGNQWVEVRTTYPRGPYVAAIVRFPKEDGTATYQVKVFCWRLYGMVAPDNSIEHVVRIDHERDLRRVKDERTTYKQLEREGWTLPAQEVTQ